MPKRNDINSILIIGAGPIVIGQACEFDYSGSQACKALREEGFRVILVNSNPATIMTDPDMADAIYIEPIHWQTVASIIAAEKPDAILPTMGGQTALNCALDLDREGVLAEHGVELIGARRQAIEMAEDRDLFRRAMQSIGLATPKSAIAHSLEQALAAQPALGYPLIIRPAFTMGGSGGGIAYNPEDLVEIVSQGLQWSPINEVLLEESVLGWKEFELEVVRDQADNSIIICGIENIDPMGVHTGDSITVAPIQTLTDREYQVMRNSALAVLRKIGVDTGGANVQFAVNPDNGQQVVIEMNPRVSRSSALASKATGFPIARVAAKLAIGYHLHELENEITNGVIPAAFEPTIDYVVTKVPRFDFEKFPQGNDRLSTQMKSVGESMAFGEQFAQSLQKALSALEIGADGINWRGVIPPPDEQMLANELAAPGAKRLWYVVAALEQGWSIDKVYAHCRIDRWFLSQLAHLISRQQQWADQGAQALQQKKRLHEMKQLGFSDQRLAELIGVELSSVQKARHSQGVHTVFSRVDSCAAEFPAATDYFYASYRSECEAQPSSQPTIVIIGGGPNRIGQGIEFDYCCVKATQALRESGYRTVMINCNPETVSTDFDTSDRLYFEPLTLEHVSAILTHEKPQGVIVQFGGQTPLGLAEPLAAQGMPIIGTSPDAIDLAEDRERFQQLAQRLGLTQPANGIATTVESALQVAATIGYPLVVRPSYVLGGRAMEIVDHADELRHYMNKAVRVSGDAPILLDQFLHDALEVDVDAVSDGKEVVICGIMEHIEQAGVHSGDSACCIPPCSLPVMIQQKIHQQTIALAKALKVVGLMNCQFAVKEDQLYILEANPRASRTVPFVSKATGKPWAAIAARCMVGLSLAEQGISQTPRLDYYAVKEAVFPFNKFSGVDPVLGPEMRSTGEAMGIAPSFTEAFAKAQWAAGNPLPQAGCVFFSVKDKDKPQALQLAQRLHQLNFRLIATRGTARALQSLNLPCEIVEKMAARPNVVDWIKQEQVVLIINTTEGRQSLHDSALIRQTALRYNICYATTLAAARAVCQSLTITIHQQVVPLDQWHQRVS